LHIPDGFLTTETWITMDIIAAAFCGNAIIKKQKENNDRKIPLMGVTASFIFAAQMLNFPVAAGTSGHFMGGLLAAILLGPHAGVIVMTAVLLIQCFLFQDGGITALGANIFNMGVIPSFLGFYIFIFIKKFIRNSKGIFISCFLAGWISTVLAAIFCSIELYISGTIPVRLSLPAMTGIHALIGIGEGIITIFVISFILKTRPDLLYQGGEN